MQPNSGSLDQVLRFLALMAGSAQYATEVSTYLAERNPTTVGVLRYSVTDANGQSALLDLVDQDYKDLSWVHGTLASIQVTDGLRIEPPFPRLAIVGQPGEILRDLHGGEFRADQFALPIVGYGYLIDLIIVTNQDDPNAASREALIHAECLDRLINRNPFLGGLVKRIESLGPGVPATAEWKGDGVVGGGHLRVRAEVDRAL